MSVAKRTVGNWERGTIIPKPAQFKLFCSLVGVPEDIIFLPKRLTKS